MYAGEPYGYLVELLRDEDELALHLKRFEKNGSYMPMLDSGAAQAYAVVDLRFPTKEQKKPSVSRPDLFTVMFSEDFKSATVYHDSDPPLMISVSGHTNLGERVAMGLLD